MTTFSRRGFLKGATAGSVVALGFPSIIGRAIADDEIKIGALHDRSGPIGIYGKEMADAIIFAADEINAAGGVGGKKFKVIEYDAQSTMQNYGQYAQRLALQDKVDVIFGGITSASRETIRPIFDRYKKLYFYSTFYEGGVCDRTEISNAETPAQINGPLMQYAMKKFNAKKIYTIAADYIYGQITADWLRKYARDYGGEVIAQEFFPLDVSDFSSTITKIQASGCDLVVSALVGGNHIGFYRQWPAAGMQGKIPLISTVFGPWEKAFVKPEEAQGILCSYHYFQTIKSPANEAFVKNWHAKFGDNYAELGTLAVCSYNSVHLYKKGVDKAGSADRMKVIEALETGISTDGPGGKVTIDAPTHHTIMDCSIAEVDKGQFKIVDTVPQRKPEDTGAVCDLVKKPDQATQFRIEVK